LKPVLVFQNVAHESLGIIADVLREAGLEFRYANLFDEVPSSFDPSELAGLVVLGGPMNVDEITKYPYLADEVQLIRQSLDAQVPLLGICLGAQLLAKSLGSCVYPAPRKEIGWYTITTTPQAASDPLLGHLRPAETVFQWHGDTFDLPDGAVNLASSPVCEDQAYRYGDRAYGLQFHVEVTSQMIDDWLDEPGGCQEIAELDYIDADEIRGQVAERLPKMHSIARPMFQTFADWCRQRVVRDG